MIIDHTLKKICLAVPKTGSTSLQKFIIENTSADAFISHQPVIYRGTNIQAKNISAEGDITHLTIEDALHLNLIADIQDYTAYGMIREPVDRLVSIAYHLMFMYIRATDKTYSRMEYVDESITGENLDYIVDKYFSLTDNPVIAEFEERAYAYFTKVNTHISRPQVTWLLYNDKPVPNIYIYPDVDKLASDFLEKPSKVTDRLRSTYRNKRGTGTLSQTLREEIIRRYKQDQELYECLLTTQKDSSI